MKGMPCSDSTRIIVCPVCGNRVRFSIYSAIIRVRHVNQVAAGKCKLMTVNPPGLDTPLALLMVCASCSHPLGHVPQRVVDAER